MEEFINSIYMSLNNNNLYGALIVALTLPDICGKIQYPNENSKIRYTNWSNKYLAPKYLFHDDYEGKDYQALTGEDCYAIRCSFLHEGIDDIRKQSSNQSINSIVFMSEGPHGCKVKLEDELFLVLKVETFCKDLCESVERWSKDLSDDINIQKRLSELAKIYYPGDKIKRKRFGDAIVMMNPG